MKLVAIRAMTRRALIPFVDMALLLRMLWSAQACLRLVSRQLAAAVSINVQRPERPANLTPGAVKKSRLRPRVRLLPRSPSRVSRPWAPNVEPARRSKLPHSKGFGVLARSRSMYRGPNDPQTSCLVRGVESHDPGRRMSNEGGCNLPHSKGAHL